ncbi:MAG: hypothetical protein GY807_08250 [Gammaproteobacteria bacterium]|nr:hypothetical protein [Gammaproteobacteria bacterium]
MERIRAGECILFLGAGVHAPPGDDPTAYPEDQRPLLGGALAEKLAQRTGFRETYPHESPTDLQRVSLAIDTQDDLGRDELVNLLQEYLGAGKQPSRMLHMLARLPFRIFVTTNVNIRYTHSP